MSGGSLAGALVGVEGRSSTSEAQLPGAVEVKKR